jgi:hypothetical protein
MIRRFGFFLILILLLGLALGCSVGGLLGGGEEEALSPTEAPAGGEQAEATEAPPSVGTETEEVEEPEEGENISLSSVTSGLQSLDSYRGYFKMTFEGSTEDEEGQWVMEMDMEHMREPFAQRVVFRGGETGLGEGFESVQIGDQNYIVFGEGQCISSSADEEDAMDMELFGIDDAIGGLEGARRARPDETVNGVLCRHYVFDEKALGWGIFTRAEGEMWVAIDGDYVVKYAVQAEGENPITGDEGNIEWEYEIRDVNEPITIEPPAGCEAAESEFPIMPAATNVSTFGDMVTYESSSSFDGVLAFYQEQMPAEGWSDTGDSFITEGTAMLGYTKDGRSVNVTLTEADGKITVMIMSE